MKKTFYVLLLALLGLFAIGQGLKVSEVYAEESYQVVMNVTAPENTPDAIYIAGTINGWGFSDDWKLSKEGSVYKLEKTLTLASPDVEFKFASGKNWDYEEIIGSNRTHTLVAGQVNTLDLTVAEWKSLPPTEPVQQLGKVVVHFQNWTGDYTDVGFHTWSQGSLDNRSYPALPSGTDDFGAYWEVPIGIDAQDEIGMIILRSGMADGTQWNHKDYSGDMKIPVTSIKEGKETEVHVYYFFGGNGQMFIARQDKINVLVAYYNPAGEYEPNLGIHAWNGWTGAFDNAWDGQSAWASPSKVFKDGLASEGDVKGKVAMLYLDPASEGAGFLVYAGGDDSKKTGDVSDFSGKPAGTIVPVYITGGDVYRGEGAAAQFAASAFTFGFVPYNMEDAKGTFAFKPTIIFIRLMLAVSTELEEGASMVDRFILKQGETVIPIEKVGYNASVDSTSEFVVYLDKANALDNTKEYTLSYAYGSDEASIEVVMDTEAPVLSNLGESVIEIQQGRKWDQALFPSFRAVDERDGTITKMVYVKSGEGDLNTGVLGEYPITLTVNDEWGNESRITFVIKVVPATGGCSTAEATYYINLMAAAVVLLFVLRKRNA